MGIDHSNPYIHSTTILCDISPLASQMWELFHILPIILGEDIAPGDNHYECFMQLQSISTTVFSPAIALDQVPLLQLEIQQYLEGFKAMYPQCKPNP